MRNYGYACINKTFSDRPKKQRITTNRTMIKRTFLEKGISYASELALQNVRDLNTILEWNLENNIYFYRLSSDMIPWASEYEMEELPDYGAGEVGSRLRHAQGIVSAQVGEESRSPFSAGRHELRADSQS